MSGLSWKINRIKAMGGKEILHRTGQTLALQVEKIRFERGWQPLPTAEVGRKTFLFSFGSQIAQKWSELFTVDSSGLTALIAGKIDFFGYDALDVGNPVQWHRDPVTGINTPIDIFGKTLDYHDDSLVGNVKFLWELGRHQHLIPLAAAYAVTGKAEYKDVVVSQIKDWISRNPFNKGIHWCTALEVALRLISWAVIHSFLHLRDNDDGLFDVADDSRELGRSIYQHAWFVAHFLSRYSSANNHLIGELTGLWVGCHVFDLGQDGKKWANQAQCELEAEAKKQVFSDGVNKEQATYYHLWVLEYLLFASLVGVRAGKPFSADFEKNIDSMAGFLTAVTPLGGVPPHIGDADDGFVTRFEARWPQKPYEDVLSAVAVSKRKQYSSDISQKAFWYGIMAGGGCKALVCKNKSMGAAVYPTVFPEGGYAVLGDELVHLIFDAGTLGYPSIAAHGHADTLSFCLAVNGDWWFVDPGTYAYHSLPEWRNYFRGTSAHNTLEIDGKNQSEIGGPFLWVKHAPVTFEGCGENKDKSQWATGEHRGYKGIVHKREITYEPDVKELLIVDTVTGKGYHRLVLNFHFSPEIYVEELSAGVWAARRKNSNCVVSVIGQNDWNWITCQAATDPISGWYSPALEIKQPTITLQGRRVCELPVTIKTLIKIQE